MKLLSVVVLEGLLLATVASAQTVPPAQDFTSLGATRTSIDVVTDTGTETRGRLLRFDAESLTMNGHGRDITFDRQHVARIYQRGDSLKNGTLIGLGVGAALGMSAGLGAECGGLFEAVRPCTAGEKVRMTAIAGGVLGAIGMGIGAGIDALRTGRRLLYEAQPQRRTATFSVVPNVTRAHATLMSTFTW